VTGTRRERLQAGGQGRGRRRGAQPPRTDRGAIASEAAGWALLAAGAALMVLPGPGIPLVLAGLVLVGRRRPWARRAHVRVREKALQAVARIQASRTRR
jgi:hypothetical protein